MKIKTLVVEDEINARKALVNMLNFYFDNIEIAGEAKNVDEGIGMIKNQSPDLVLLDIRLPDGTGFDLIKKTQAYDFKLIFVTAYDEYALQAIKLSALDYLLKPVKPEELRQAIQKVCDAIENDERLNIQIDSAIENVKAAPQNKKIVINTTDSIIVVELQDFIRCEGCDNYTNVFINGKDKILISKTLKQFEEILTPLGFFRVHQSHLINLQYVDHVEKKSSGLVVLKDETPIPLSVRRREGFLKALEASF